MVAVQTGALAPGPYHHQQQQQHGYVQWGYDPHILGSEFLGTTQTEKYVYRHTFLPKQVTGVHYFADRLYRQTGRSSTF
jgi:hypothetical protein